MFAPLLKRALFPTALGWLTVGVMACHATPASSPPKNDAGGSDVRSPCLSEAKKNQVTEIIDEVMKDARYAIPGLSLSIKADCGEDFHLSRGTARLGANARVTEHTPFRVGSVTKAFTGHLTMVLVQSGYLTVDATLADRLPGIAAKLPRLDVGRITIRHLLNHTSGIPTYAAHRQGIYAQVLANPTAVWPHDAILDAISQASPLSAPGVAFHYSNANYYLLGMVIEHATGMSYEQALARFVIGPLGLAETFAPAPGRPGMPEHGAHGYMERSETDATLRDVTALDSSYPWAAGSLISTTSDLASFARALHERRLLSGPHRDELYFPIPEAPGFSYGAGITKDDGNGTVGHDGNIFGYECSSLYVMRAKAAVSACVNRSLFDETLPPDTSLRSVLMQKVVAVLNLPDIADDRVESFRRAGGIDGIQLAVMSHGQRIVTKYGKSGPEAPWSDGDLFRIASVSKSFLAALTLKIAETGELGIADTIDSYFPADLLPNIDLKVITIGDLLRHSSGIPDFFTDAFIQGIVDHPDVEKTEADALRAIRDLPRAFAPGTAVAYSNSNYVLLGMILDHIARKRGLQGHQDLLREYVIAPLALSSTFQETREAARFDPNAIVSGFLDGKDYRHVQQGYGLPNGGLVSTVADVATFFDALHDPASPAYLAPKMAPPPGEDFGFGLYRLRPGKPFIGHTGEFAGYLTFAAHDPITGTTIVGIANNSGAAAKAEFKNLQDDLFSRLGNGD